jgi:hypothetical protein
VGIIVALLLLVISAVVVLVVSAPLRSRGAGGGRSQQRRDELLASREAKYREIRDAELDYRTGKLSRADYEAIDAALRAEAIEILDRLEGEGGLGPGTLEQQDGEHEEQDGEEDRPAI